MTSEHLHTPRSGPTPPPVKRRVNLFEVFPLVKKFAQLRSFQFLLVLPTFALFYVFVIAGIIGSPVGNRNIIIVFVWILWWFLLMAFMVPFFSRLWCIMCPVPFFGEWLQRRAFIKVRPGKTGGLHNTMYGLNKRWPHSLSNIWIQNIGFMLLATFFVILATRPFVSAVVLGGMFVLATLLALVFQRRVFCTYLCPVSGFLGLYSMSSSIELRAVDPDVCVRCKTKNCSTGSENGWACPWFLYMGKLDRNNFCGLCMECIKSCESQNIGLFLRPFFSDTKMQGYDEAWKAFIMLAVALIYAVVLQGPWGFVKDYANITEARDWSGFLLLTSIVWAVSLLVLPGIWGLTTLLSRQLAGTKRIPWKKLFIGYSYALVPLGLSAWLAFSVPLVMVNGSYIVSVLSDPLGRGWNLFGTAGVPWTPVFPEYAVYPQILFLLVGLFFAVKKVHEIGKTYYDDERKLRRSIIPPAVFCAAITIVFISLFAG